MKVIQPLFLDKLEGELESSRTNEGKLKALLDRIAKIKVFDPACGSGNFLIIAYKELRKIEMGIFKALDEVGKQKVIFMSRITLSHFYGIEIDDFAHEIALLSLWLTEHQMNQAFKNEFGYAAPTLPLKESGNVVAGNSLRLDWNEVCPKDNEDEVYVCGNPPFLGHAGRSDGQNEDMDIVLSEFEMHGYLDFVGCWFWKGAKYIDGSQSELAFVATNSLCQGLQVEMLWDQIIKKGLYIHFAYQSFQWKNSARENAGVVVCVVGLTNNANAKKRLFKLVEKSWHEVSPKNISPYLIEAGNTIIRNRPDPLAKIHKMAFGSMPRDGGNLFLTPVERREFISTDSKYEKWIRKILGASEFLNGGERYCLWLENFDLMDLPKYPLIEIRVKLVRNMRLESKAKSTREFATTPHLFAQRSHPATGSYIIVPRVSTDRRNFLPVGFFDSSIVSTDLNQIIPNGTLFEAGVIMTTMHMEWLKVAAGRLGNGFRYSSKLVYNTFPWPNVSTAQLAAIEKLVEEIMLIREDYPDKTLAKLYDPDLMPATLLAAHQALDAAVEKLYRAKPFKDASERLEHLFARYEKLVANEPYKEPSESGNQVWLI